MVDVIGATGSYLFVYWRYKIESLSLFVFPVVFIMTLMGTFGNPGSLLASDTFGISSPGRQGRQSGFPAVTPLNEPLGRCS